MQNIFGPLAAQSRLPPFQRDVLGTLTPRRSGAAAPGPTGARPTETREQLGSDLVRTAPSAKGSYEARVLQGIWAAAPYLHNGSVPTLAELLKPSAERVKAFKIGPAYDIVNVGLAIEQTQFNYTLTTTDCSDRNSGNSRCGHEFGTQLMPDEKKALLEYLKTL